MVPHGVGERRRDRCAVPPLAHRRRSLYVPVPASWLTLLHLFGPCFTAPGQVAITELTPLDRVRSRA
jgi:hypothetical protein